VRARLTLAALAVVVAVGVVVWGFAPGVRSVPSRSASARTPANSISASPSASAGAQTSASGASPSSSADLTRNMHLVFDASFHGSKLNTSIWDTCYPYSPQYGCTNFSNGKKEVEWYTPSQVRVSGGALNLTATRKRISGFSKGYIHSKVYDCRSGMVTSYPGFNFKYGYLEVVAHIPDGAGLWPALWLAASNFQWPPEIDLLEAWGPPLSGSGMFFHPIGGDQVVVHPPTSADVTSGWHTFAVYWTASQVSWYLDGQLMFSVVQNIPHLKMYFIANVADYKANRRSECNGTLKIRSVKVWQS
jgi:beta-glucanase (GH16 family)